MQHQLHACKPFDNCMISTSYVAIYKTSLLTEKLKYFSLVVS